MAADSHRKQGTPMCKILPAVGKQIRNSCITKHSKLSLSIIKGLIQANKPPTFSFTPDSPLLTCLLISV